MPQTILPATQKFQRVPATEAINRKAVERKYHQLLAGYSTAYGLVASTSSFPVLNAVFRIRQPEGGRVLCQKCFRGGGTIAGISLLPVFVGLKRISSLTTIFKYSNHLWPTWQQALARSASLGWLVQNPTLAYSTQCCDPQIADPRDPGCIVPPLAAILRARIPAIAGGFADADGLVRLRTAQALRCVSRR